MSGFFKNILANEILCFSPSEVELCLSISIFSCKSLCIKALFAAL